MNNLFTAVRITVKQALNNLFFLNGFRKNFRNIPGFYLKIANPFRIFDDNRPPLAKTVTAGFPDLYLTLQTLLFDLRFDRFSHPGTAGGQTGGTGTKGNTRFIGVSF